jgi:hypothetical protein
VDFDKHIHTLGSGVFVIFRPESLEGKECRLTKRKLRDLDFELSQKNNQLSQLRGQLEVLQIARNTAVRNRFERGTNSEVRQRDDEMNFIKNEIAELRARRLEVLSQIQAALEGSNVIKLRPRRDQKEGK